MTCPLRASPPAPSTLPTGPAVSARSTEKRPRSCDTHQSSSVPCLISVLCFGTEINQSTLEKLTLHLCHVMKRIFLGPLCWMSRGRASLSTGSALTLQDATIPRTISPKKFLLAMWWEPALCFAAEGLQSCHTARQAIGTSSLARTLLSLLGTNFICIVAEQMFLFLWDLCTSS